MLVESLFQSSGWLQWPQIWPRYGPPLSLSIILGPLNEFKDTGNQDSVKGTGQGPLAQFFSFFFWLTHQIPFLQDRKVCGSLAFLQSI